MRRVGVTAGAILWSLLPVAASAQTLDLTLHPPAERPLRMDNRVTISVGFEAGQPPSFTDDETAIRRTVFTREPDHWIFSTQIVDTRTTRNGARVADPVREALRDQPVTFVFNGQGELLRVEGVDALAVHLDAALGPSPFWDAERLTVAYRNIFEEGFGLVWRVLAGRSVGLGVPFKDERDLPFARVPGFEARFPSAGTWTFLGRASPEPASAARFRYAYGSTPVSLDEAMREAVRAWLTAQVPQVAPAAWFRAQLDVRGELLIDPATLLPVRWTDVRLVTLTPKSGSETTIRVESTGGFTEWNER